MHVILHLNKLFVQSDCKRSNCCRNKTAIYFPVFLCHNIAQQLHKEMLTIKNTKKLSPGQFDSDFNTPKYAEFHYGDVSDADNWLSNWVVSVLRRPGIRRDFKTAKEIGTGGVLRTAMLGAGNLSEHAKVTCTDVGESQMQETLKAIADIMAGNPSKWRLHEKGVIKGHPKVDEGRGHPWMVGALDKICAGATVEQFDIREAPLGPAGMRFEGFCLCSNTDDPDQYELEVDNFYGGMMSNDVAVRMFDIESKGYWVDGRFFPGIPINPTKVIEQAKRIGLVVVDSIGIEFGASSSTFTGIGAAVMIKP